MNITLLKDFFFFQTNTAYKMYALYNLYLSSEYTGKTALFEHLNKGKKCFTISFAIYWHV